MLIQYIDLEVGVLNGGGHMAAVSCALIQNIEVCPKGSPELRVVKHSVL